MADMLAHMKFKELQEYAKVNGVSVRDANLCCDRQELLVLIEKARGTERCPDTHRSDLEAMELLIQLGGNPRQSPGSKPQPSGGARSRALSTPPRPSLERRREGERELLAEREAQLVHELTHDVLGFPYEEWQCCSPRNRAVPLPSELWPTQAAEKADMPTLRQLCRDGAPHVHRSQAWLRICTDPSPESWQSSAINPSTPATPEEYHALLHNNGEPITCTAVDRDIAKDIHRTFPGNPQFMGSNGPEKLEQLLTAYSRRCPEVGYCQGMNFVAATLLLACQHPETSFAVLCHLLEAVVPGYYSHNLAGVLIDVEVLRMLLQERYPALHGAFKEIGYDVMVLLPRWLCTLLVNILPTESALRVWDACMVDGRVALLSVTLALFGRAEPKVLALVEACGHIDEHAEVLMHVDAIFKSVTTAATDADQLLAQASLAGLSPSQLLELTRAAASQFRAQQAELEMKKFDWRMASDTHFSVAEIEQLRLAHAERLQASGAAGLDVSKLQDVLGTISPKHRQMASLVHHAFDANRDGTVDLKEMILGLSSLCKGTTRQRLELAFRCYDIDYDGKLDWDEVKNMVWVLLQLHYQQPPARETVNQMAHSVFRQLDCDHNGLIDMDEWVQGVTTMPIVMECFCEQHPEQNAVETAIVRADATKGWKGELNSMGDKLVSGLDGTLKAGLSSLKSLWS